MVPCQRAGGQGSSTLMMSVVGLRGGIESGRLLGCSQVILNLCDSVSSNTIKCLTFNQCSCQVSALTHQCAQVCVCLLLCDWEREEGGERERAEQRLDYSS